MVCSVIPHTSIGSSIRYKCRKSTQNGTSKNVVPVMGHVEHKGTDDASSKCEWEYEEDDRKVRRVCVSKDFELAIDV